MEDLYKGGKCTSIGVSNYTVSHLKDLLSYCTVKPACNQIEFHPQLLQEDIVDFCQKEDILIEAYTPLGKGNNGQLLNHKVVVELSKKYEKTPAQIVLRWGIQKNNGTLI